MAICLLWQPTGTIPIFAGFAEGYDPHVYGPPLVQTGIPYWFVEREFIQGRLEIYGPTRAGWILTEDPGLGDPDGYGA